MDKLRDSKVTQALSVHSTGGGGAKRGIKEPTGQLLLRAEGRYCDTSKQESEGKASEEGGTSGLGK